MGSSVLVFGIIMLAYSTVASETKGGAVYVRWGRSTCPNEISELLYNGEAGGSYKDHKGSGANYLCLPKHPQWANHDNVLKSSGGKLYGSEYHLWDGGQPFSNMNAPHLHDHDVPCAVCRATYRTSHVMIPAMTECMEGWTKEYQGYLMSQHWTLYRTEFVCVDKDPEVAYGGRPNKDGVLFYPVEAVCGSLPCPPYVDGREIACVVCTQ